ncbi:LysM peptidoglycan-binding domain-containing protein [Fibrisoma montanum]|uniref:LysM peptidoglycan-binding domain-containing protein n=1 Tax=Fibrisoma montanum TaxID=2305895 RepID=A0A418M954_9BACT|nr:lytic transglycosylase domain-containing protein [Fibrisoma montanum]RIV22629.1 LysM peptidoglycan-binding domain-containing protein [Fibrisoma montanum]
MQHMNRSLLIGGLLSVALGLVSVAHAQTTILTGTPGQKADSASVIKADTVAYVPTVPDSLIMERLARLQKTIPLPYHQTVHAYVDYFTFRKPSFTRTMLERMPMFFPLYERLLAQYGLPDELKYLSIVESALNPRAISHAGAGGLWQIMPGTGRDLRLYQDDYVDERMDPVKATEAACKYLRDLYNIFGDWHLALAAYNSGPGKVKRAMRRSGGDSFWTVFDQLPKETRAYVPQFIAQIYMMNHANEHGIIAENYERPIPHDTIQIHGYFNLETFAKHSQIALEDLKKMNPAVTTTILPEYTRGYPLRIPRANYGYFTSRRRAIMDSASRIPVAMAHVLLASAEDIQYNDSLGKLYAQRDVSPLANLMLEELAEETESVNKAAGKASALAANEEPEADDIETVVLKKPRKQTHTVKRGESLFRLADRYNVEVYDLKQWNHLRSNAIKPGQKLIVLKEAAETRSEQLAEQGTPKGQKKAAVAASAKRYKPRYHRVQAGDTLWNISQRYGGISIDKLKKLNHIRGNSLRPGQKLIVG